VRPLQKYHPEARLSYILKSLPYSMPGYYDVEFQELRTKSNRLKELQSRL